MALLTWLTRKDQPFSWGVEADNAFQYLKTYFTSAPLFIHVNPSKPFVLETYAFDFEVGVMFSQLREENFLHFVGFRSCKFSLAEINYEIHDK